MLLLLSNFAVSYAFAIESSVDFSASQLVDGFYDVKNHWAEEEIVKAVARGYVTGYPDRSFRPDNYVTKAEFLTMIVSSLGLKPTENTSTPWYNAYIQIAFEAEIYEGEYTDTEWDLELKRAEIAKFLIKALNAALPEPDKEKFWSSFSYHPDRSFWYSSPIKNAYAHMRFDYTVIRADYDTLLEYEDAMRNRQFIKGEYRYEYPNTRYNDAAYMYLATSLGIITGLGDGIVGSDYPTTRAQAVTVIERLLAKIDGQQLEPADKLTRENAEFEWHNTNLYTAWNEYLDLRIQGEMLYGLSHNHLRLEANDGTYYGELTKLAVVDLEDPQEIEKYGVDLENWQWIAGAYSYDIKDYTQSYLFIWESEVAGEDPRNEYLPLHISIRGERRTETQEEINQRVTAEYEDLQSGNLNRSTYVVDKRYYGSREWRGMPVIIIPKNHLNGTISISLSSSNYPGAMRREIMLMHVSSLE